jgi:hypothetical protein
VVALLNNFAFLHHNYVVCVPDRGEAVSNDYSRDGAKVLPNLIYSCLYFLFVFLVKGGSRLV